MARRSDQGAPRLWKSRIGVAGALLAIAVVIHRGWFAPGLLVSGDWRYFAGAHMRSLPLIPSAWDELDAFGRLEYRLPGAPYFSAFALLARLSVSYAWAERLLFFFPFSVISLAGMYRLSIKFVSSSGARVIAAVAYAGNTHILDISNHQLTVAMAYALAPGAAALALSAVNSETTTRARMFSVLAGAVLGTSMAYDARIGGLAALLTFGLIIVSERHRIQRGLYLALVVTATTIGSQAYWLVPHVFFGHGVAVSALLPQRPFISWATFAHAVGLQDPFWSTKGIEVFVVQPPAAIFLIGAAIVVATLGQRSNPTGVNYLGAAAVAAVFLVKGENPPFGEFYRWAFTAVPGMRFFRDMSKFNLIVALGYSVTFAVAAQRAGVVFRRAVSGSAPIVQAAAQLAVIAAIVAVVVVPLIPALAGTLNGTHDPVERPLGHLGLERLLERDARYGRVLWVPHEPVFNFRSQAHPAVSAVELLKDPNVRADDLSELLAISPDDDAGSGGAVDLFRQLSIRYVVLVQGTDLSAWERVAAVDAGAAVANVRASLGRVPGLDEKYVSSSRVAYEVDAPLPLAEVEGDARGFEFERSWHHEREFRWNEPHRAEQSMRLFTLREAYSDKWRAAFTGVTTTGKTLTLDAIHRKTEHGFNAWAVSVPPDTERVEGSAVISSQSGVRIGLGITLATMVVVALLPLMCWISARNAP